MTQKIRIATYNIHTGIGMDGAFDIERIINVLEEIQPDIVAIQEVSTDPSICHGINPVASLQKHFGPYISAAASLIGSRGNHYGNLLLSRYPITKSSSADLSSHNREPRNIIDVDINIKDKMLRVITTHMGLAYSERQTQTQKLIPLLNGNPDRYTILLGDMNEWLYGSPTLKLIDKHLYSPNSPASFMARLPIFSLDRIWGRPASIFSGKVKAHRSRLSRQASDHLPVYADILIG